MKSPYVIAAGLRLASLEVAETAQTDYYVTLLFSMEWLERNNGGWDQMAFRWSVNASRVARAVKRDL